jgi:hypothetical protein
MDLADASLVAVAERDGINKVFTLDRRDFGVYRPAKLGRFSIIPWPARLPSLLVPRATSAVRASWWCAGRVVEELSADQLRAAAPAEPYTRQLLQASLGYDRQAAAQLTTFD